MTMRICAFDGSVSFECCKVTRGLDRQGFLASSLAAGARQRLVNREWWHFSFDPEPGFTARLVFRGDQLDSVFILMDLPPDKRAEWTEANELERKALHDDWLRREIGMPPYEYAWGWIESFYDAKSCVSEIIVKYGS